MKQGNLTVASMLTTLRDMMGFMKLPDATSILGTMSQKDLAQLNRQLTKIRK